MMGLSATDVLDFRKAMEELGINLNLDDVARILRIADDMNDARSIAKEVGDGASLLKIYDKRILLRIIALEKKVAELAERLDIDE